MRPSLLLVEDDEDFRGALVRSLGQNGFGQVTEAASVDEALEILAAMPFEVILTDLRLGARDGIDLIQTARQRYPSSRPILMSAYATSRDVQTALSHGAVTILSKPFTFEELLAAIQQAAECGTGFHGSIHGISLVDMLQMFNLARRTLKLSVNGETSGTIHLQEGEVVHVEAGPLQGEEAFRRLLGAPAGSLQTGAATEGVERTIARDFQTLLIDSLRIIDEQTLVAGGSTEPLASLVDGLNEGQSNWRDEMANVKDALAKVMELDGCLGTCIVDSNSGMMLGSQGGGGLNLEVAAAGNTEVVRAKRKTMKSLGLADGIEDILITLGKQYHVIRPVTANDALFMYVVLDKQKSNLAMARHQVGAIEKELQVS